MKRTTAFGALIRGRLPHAGGAEPALLLYREDGRAWTLPNRTVADGNGSMAVTMEFQRLGLMGAGLTLLGHPIEHPEDQYECYLGYYDGPAITHEDLAWVRLENLGSYPVANPRMFLLLLRALSLTMAPLHNVQLPAAREALPRIISGWDMHPNPAFKVSPCAKYVYRTCGSRIIIWNHAPGTLCD